ncbi:cytochrome P450 [Vararia minispora EC-137]|uniref:Cytochrome P450 n=1 Tax=Vararia minispora EC-137 TaxID=1314806 RepID=A0ACB8QKQ9_9AGAM|nr:cytochrome P450 [Vararia minispora EC-137]
MEQSILLAATVAASALALHGYFSRRSSLPLPPGPRRLPIIGNLLDIPKVYPWIKYSEWAKKYGDVISLSVFGHTMIILNTHEAIKNVVLARSTKFSGRPHVQYADMADWSTSNLSVMSATREWADRYRIMNNYFRPKAIQRYRQVQTEKLVSMMKRVIKDPNNVQNDTRKYAAAFIMDVVYGFDVETGSQHLVQINEDFQKYSYLLLPGALIVNSLPILGRLPPWMLGHEFATLVEKGREAWRRVREDPFNWVKAGIKGGTAKESLVRTSLADLAEGDANAERVISDAFGNVFSAGVDTSYGTIRNALLQMALQPSIQVKAQEELDRVVGSERLPNFDDRANLPYIQAILMEALRWEPLIPLGIPHKTEEDVFLDDFYIPKGAMVIGNTGAILTDPARYPDPGAFKPERHLSADGQVVDDPLIDYAFGFGTRRCPGRHFFDMTTWLYLATILTFFNITKAKDENGNEIPVEVKYDGALAFGHAPLPFSCAAVPRDLARLERLLQQY